MLAAYVGEHVAVRCNPGHGRDPGGYRHGFLCRAVCPALACTTISFKAVSAARNARRRGVTRACVSAGYACPQTVRRLGRGRLARFLHRHSRGAWTEAKAEELLATAAATLRLWGQDLDYPDLADDIASRLGSPWPSPRRSRNSTSASPCCSPARTPAASCNRCRA
uniref:hypothetical protein n=1 Tax=Actinomadura sp. CA-154981 TaxID=3240037 RepID=UPI003F495A13